MFPILAEIQMFGFPYAPSGWAQCDGSALPIAQYTGLNTLLAGRFGRSGQNLLLPDLRDRVPGGVGAGHARAPRVMAEAYGEAMVLLKETHMTPHRHQIVSYATREAQGRKGVPGNGDRLASPALAFGYNAQSHLVDTTLALDTLGATGGNEAHENRQPYQSVGFCICVKGDYPQFS